MTITHDDDILGGEPRIEGTRVGVRHVVGLVIDGGLSPETAADSLDLSLEEVQAAMSYYRNHTREIRQIEAENVAAIERLRHEALHPKERA